MKPFDWRELVNAAGAANPMHDIIKDALRFTLLMRTPIMIPNGCCLSSLLI